MKELNFKNYPEFALEIADKYDSLVDTYDSLSIIAKYEETRQIIKELIFLDYDLVMLDLKLEDSYNDEYVVTLDKDGIWCEPMKHKNKYIDVESSIIYVSDDCNSIMLSHLKSNFIISFGFVIEEDKVDKQSNLYNAEYENVDCKENKNTSLLKDDIETKAEKSNGTNSVYKVNGNIVDKEAYDKKSKDFNDNIRRCLLAYCEFMDEVNEWNKLFNCKY